MNDTLKNWKAWLYTGAALTMAAIGAGAFLLVSGGAQAKAEDWPPLTMTYSVEVAVDDGTITQVRELSYVSQDSWIELVTEAEDIETPFGTFNDAGSYQKIQNGQYIVYDVTTGETFTETIEDGVTKIPRAGISPTPLASMESVLEKQFTEVSTTTKVCFDDVCSENATGWEMREGNQAVVFADDARGIPVKIGDFTITEVQIQGNKNTFR